MPSASIPEVRKGKPTRTFYFILLGVLSLVLTERMTPHLVYRGFYIEKAQRALEKKQPEKAKVNFLRAIEIDPLAATPYYELGEVLRTQGNCAEAVPYLQKATYLDFDYGPAQLALGSCYYQSGLYARARVNLNKALDLDPTLKECRYWLIVTSVKLGRYFDATQYFKWFKEYKVKEYIGLVEPLLKQYKKK